MSSSPLQSCNFKTEKEKTDLNFKLSFHKRLINAIQPDAIKKINTRPIALLEMVSSFSPHSPCIGINLMLVSQENLGFYLKACWHLGVPSSDLFVTSDLYLSKDERQVWLQEPRTRTHACTHGHESRVMKCDGWREASTFWCCVALLQVFQNLLSLSRIAESTKRFKGPTMASLGYKVWLQTASLASFCFCSYCSLSSQSKLQKSKPPNGLAP